MMMLELASFRAVKHGTTDTSRHVKASNMTGKSFLLLFSCKDKQLTKEKEPTWLASSVVLHFLGRCPFCPRPTSLWLLACNAWTAYNSQLTVCRRHCRLHRCSACKVEHTNKAHITLLDKKATTVDSNATGMSWEHTGIGHELCEGFILGGRTHAVPPHLRCQVLCSERWCQLQIAKAGQRSS